MKQSPPTLHEPGPNRKPGGPPPGDDLTLTAAVTILIAEVGELRAAIATGLELLAVAVAEIAEANRNRQ